MNEYSKNEVMEADLDLRQRGLLPPRFLKQLRKAKRAARDKELMRRSFLGKNAQ